MMIPVSKSQSIAVLRSPLSSQADSHTQLINMWQQWATQAPPGMGEDRNIAVERLKDCLWRQANQLNLSHLGLTVLPALLPNTIEQLELNHNRLITLPDNLPDSIWRLEVTHNQLTSLPEKLPKRLNVLYVSNNRLTRLSSRLPNGLIHLDISHNQLTVLPKTLPNSLRTLGVSDNQLIRLPNNLRYSLKKLHVGHNQLRGLPKNMPCGLTELIVDNNQLTCLPDCLPNSLTILSISNNQLTRLPSCLPVSLRYFFARNNQLTCLAADLPDSLVMLNVSGNPLDRNGLAYTDFLTKMVCWDLSMEIKPWKNIYTEAYASDFAAFLNKLHGKNHRDSRGLRQRIAIWLDYLAKDGHAALRAQTFALAKEAAESCVDRAAYYFTRMHILMVEHQQLNAAAPVVQVIETIRTNFRLQVLKTIAAKHVAARRAPSPDFAEDVEIHFAYQYKLREVLSLPVYGELQFGEIAKLSNEDINNAREVVREAENRDFMRYWLTESVLWTATLEKWQAEKIEKETMRYAKVTVSEDFKAEIKKELVDKGIAVTDDDALRGMSKYIGDQLFYAQRYKLTQEYLANNKQALSLLYQYQFNLPALCSEWLCQ